MRLDMRETLLYDQNQGPKKLLLVIAILGLILFILFIKTMIDSHRRYLRKRDYYKIEIGRATSPVERERWEQKLRELYFSRIPVFNKRTWYAIRGFFHDIKKLFQKKRKKKHRHHRHHQS